METGTLGKRYENGQEIVHQGEPGNCMYVIQSGQVEVVRTQDGKEVRVAVRGEGDFFGEMAVFEHEVRMATVRALGPATILTVDKKGLLRRFQHDPSLAFRIVETMSKRIRELTEQVLRRETGA
jgi:CRP-like cAMP-binding protein